jgi:hypothetical protein
MKLCFRHGALIGYMNNVGISIKHSFMLVCILGNPQITYPLLFYILHVGIMWWMITALSVHATNNRYLVMPFT